MERIKSGYWNNHLYVNVRNSAIHISQKVGEFQMPINWWIDDQNMVYPYTTTIYHNIVNIAYIYIVHKKECNADTHCNADEPWKHAQWKQPVTKLIWFHL